MRAVDTTALASFAADQQAGEQSHTMAITEVSVASQLDGADVEEASQLDGAGVEDSDAEQGKDFNFMVLKGMVAEMPADQQTCVAQLVELLGDGDLSLNCIFLKEIFQSYFSQLGQDSKDNPCGGAAKSMDESRGSEIAKQLFGHEKVHYGIGSPDA